jgi:dUTP pyrophosphatase
MRELSVKCKANAGCIPEYRSAGAAGADLVADVDEAVELAPGERALVPTGLWLQVPDGFEAQIRPRSGLALRHGVTLLNSPGTIDSDYRGEIKLVMVNLGSRNYRIVRGDRVAQIVFCSVARAKFESDRSLPESARGSGGFGSTGV